MKSSNSTLVLSATSLQMRGLSVFEASGAGNSDSGMQFTPPLDSSHDQKALHVCRPFTAMFPHSYGFFLLSASLPHTIISTASNIYRNEHTHLLYNTVTKCYTEFIDNPQIELMYLLHAFLRNRIFLYSICKELIKM